MSDRRGWIGLVGIVLVIGIAILTPWGTSGAALGAILIAAVIAGAAVFGRDRS